MLLSDEGHANRLKKKCLLFWWVMKSLAGNKGVLLEMKNTSIFAKYQVTSNVLYVSNWLHKELKTDHKVFKNFSKRALESSNRLL